MPTKISVYDLRMNSPLTTFDHRYDLPIKAVHFHQGDIIITYALSSSPHHHQPGGRTHLLVVPSVHSNRSFEEVLNHFSFQPQSISRIHSSFLSLLTKSHKQLEAASFFRYSLQRMSEESLEAGT